MVDGREGQRPKGYCWRVVMVKTVTVREDPKVSAVVIAERELFYAEGEDEREDRPRSVRAGSGLALVQEKLVVVQDDALFVAVIDAMGKGAVHALAMEREAGVRLFGSDRGNKHRKPDYECLVQVAPGVLWALGSGSTAARRRVLRILFGSERSTLEAIECDDLYVALEAHRDFSGSEMNIEGAAVMGDTLRLFQRGNGAARGALRAVNATVDLPLRAVMNYVDGRAQRAERGCDVAIGEVRQYELGAVGGVSYGFTDACSRGEGEDGMVWVAAAEASPDTYRDGETMGVCIGWMHADGTAGRGPVVTPTGELYKAKIEGICVDPLDATRGWAVVDVDAVNAPAKLLTLELRGLGG